MSTLSNPNPSPTTAGPKLRDSCDACASSKLKCPKQKPTCARCAKRGVPCNYLATRRAGRRTERRRDSISPPQPSPAAAPAQLQLDQLDLQMEGFEWFGAGTVPGTPGASAGDDYFQLGPTPELSTGTASIPSSGLNSSPLSPVDYASMMTNLDDFLFQPSSNLWIPDMSSRPDVLGQGDTDFFNIPGLISDDHGKKLDLLDASNQFMQIDQLNSSDTCTSSEKQKQQGNGEVTTNTAAQISESFGCCLMKALCLLQQLFPQSASVVKGTCKNRTSSDIFEKPFQDNPPLPTIVTVIGTNKQAMDSVGAMMECDHCSQNGYLLALISLIAFKVLDSYDAAFSNTPQTETHLTPEEDPKYMAAQTVLGELHRVQRLVNQLSVKMEKQVPRTQNGNIAAALCSVGPFSSTMLSQLESDIRKRLKRLSGELVAYMRRD